MQKYIYFFKLYIYIQTYLNPKSSASFSCIPRHDSWLEPVSKTQSCRIEGRLLAVIMISLSLGEGSFIPEKRSHEPLWPELISGFILVHNIRFTVFPRGVSRGG